MNQINKFYQRLASHYDEMTSFHQRFEAEKQVIQKWIERLKILSAVDAACGTGLHAILLAASGVHTVGSDHSGAMLEVAKNHAREHGVEVTWLQSDMQDLSEHLHERYDAVFCLGNSLPHLLSDNQLSTALQSFVRLLQPRGWVIIQLLNYDRILTRQERIIGINRQDNHEYIRFYDFQGELLQFNILTIQATAGKLRHELHSTPLRPYRQQELLSALTRQGFVDFEQYGDLNLSPYEAEDSPNLVLVARKDAGKQS